LKRLKSFSLVDLSVVIGLILVLAGASLMMFGKVFKNQRDNERISSLNAIYESMQEYYKSNFRTYPLPQSADGSTAYSSVVIGKDNDAFLQVTLGDKVTKLSKETSPDYDYVYIYSNDGQQAAIVLRKLESGRAKCNTDGADIPEIIKDYLTKDPNACYFRAST